MKTRHKWTPQEDKRLRNLNLAGVGMMKIAMAIGQPVSEVETRMDELDLWRNPSARSTEDPETPNPREVILRVIKRRGS